MDCCFLTNYKLTKDLIIFSFHSLCFNSLHILFYVFLFSSHIPNLIFCCRNNKCGTFTSCDYPLTLSIFNSHTTPYSSLPVWTVFLNLFMFVRFFSKMLVFISKWTKIQSKLIQRQDNSSGPFKRCVFLSKTSPCCTY